LYYVATFVNRAYAIKITQQLNQLGIPLTVIFSHVGCKLAHNNGHGPFKQKGWTYPCFKAQ
jgi:hypothetical protein